MSSIATLALSSSVSELPGMMGRDISGSCAQMWRSGDRDGKQMLAGASQLATTMISPLFLPILLRLSILSLSFQNCCCFLSTKLRSLGWYSELSTVLPSPALHLVQEA